MLRRRHVARRWVAALVTVTVASCGREAAGWQMVAAADPGQRARAEAARDALGKALLGRLSAALANGPAAAVSVCRAEAPALAQAIATAQGVRIGRTSRRLRNPDNGPPPWAQAAIADDASQPRMFAGPAGELGALYPIVLQPVCVQCHGKDGDVSAEVRTQLARDYPEDLATGYAPGDVRGYFWVEVPRSP